ncbi:hypothetical protein KO516_15490 [Citreicella sp. C3M06]|uniref:hypothetical protein n=1 Tax=Roseobacteraceae TaxID=2854170 RepID=UPI001C09E8C1|nr:MULTISPECIES: hypothetical protein [Roseobacteraceae]MBU2962190.1 hypothetical protein [Citreicella sp. C3M06]MDO6585445.1 hypothetical protein [Salipiger sp. 1_MG-2023]
MNHLLKTLGSRLERRVKYLRTLRELRSMPLDVALDLDINPGDARRIAALAVYGRA